jgi:hypothetical protein
MRHESHNLSGIRPRQWRDRRALIHKESILRTHRFLVGQSVHYALGRFGNGGASGVYKIVRQLPPEGDDYQYRIKSANEPHERIAKESQLERAG